MPVGITFLNMVMTSSGRASVATSQSLALVAAEQIADAAADDPAALALLAQAAADAEDVLRDLGEEGLEIGRHARAYSASRGGPPTARFAGSQLATSPAAHAFSKIAAAFAVILRHAAALLQVLGEPPAARRKAPVARFALQHGRLRRIRRHTLSRSQEPAERAAPRQRPPVARTAVQRRCARCVRRRPWPLSSLPPAAAHPPADPASHALRNNDSARTASAASPCPLSTIEPTSTHIAAEPPSHAFSSRGSALRKSPIASSRSSRYALPLGDHRPELLAADRRVSSHALR